MVIHPQVALTAATAFTQTVAHRGLIDLQVRAVAQILPDVVVDRREPVGRHPHPVAHRFARQFDAVARVQDLLLAIQRQMIHVLLQQDVGQQPRAGITAFDQARGQRRDQRRTVPIDFARELAADDAAAKVTRRHHVQFFGDFLADAPIRAGVLLDGFRINDLFFHRQVLRQAGLALRPAPTRARRGRRGWLVIVWRGLLQGAQQQFQLVAVELLALASEKSLQEELHLAVQQRVFTQQRVQSLQQRLNLGGLLRILLAEVFEECLHARGLEQATQAPAHLL